jgi:hypothetical protein
MLRRFVLSERFHDMPNGCDIVFVSNYSSNLDYTLDQIRINLPAHVNSIVLTYKKSNIRNSFSYEEFLESEFEKVNSCDIVEFNNTFKDVNLNLSIVAERFLSDYYNLGASFGYKKYSNSDIEFIIKSWVFFLDEYISDGKIIFSGYADNMVSNLAFLLSDFRGKKCITFNTISVVSPKIYLSDSIFMQPYDSLMSENKIESIEVLIDYINTFTAQSALKEYQSNKRLASSPALFGFISARVLDMGFWKYALFGYKVKNKFIKKYLELDRVSLVRKMTAYAVKTFNFIVTKIYLRLFSKSKIDYDKTIYFPLQVQPEASTATTSPLFVNLVSTIELISKSLPIGYTLIVKEHPVAPKGRRNLNTYRRINSFHNVSIVNSKVNGKDLIRNSELIIGFGGTTLIESILLGKKILIFEDAFYSDSILVKKVESVRKLYKHIFDMLMYRPSDKEKTEDLHKMLNFFNQRGFELDKDFEKNIAVNLLSIIERS